MDTARMIDLGNGKYRPLEEINSGLELIRAMKERVTYLEGVRDQSCEKKLGGSNNIYCDCEYCIYYNELKCIQDESKK